MKKLTLLLLLLLSVVASSQITVEIISSSGEYRSHVNGEGRVHLEVRNDSLLIHSNGLVAVYRIERIVVTQPAADGSFLGVYEIFILNDSHELATVTMWPGISLVVFAYRNGTQVLNSGEGVTYYTGSL